MTTEDLPALNATLNAISGVLLVVGYVFIRRKQRTAHKRCMLAAFGVSVVFLISYLTYHGLHGSTPYEGEGALRVLYFVILVPHIILAALVPPFAIFIIVKAFRGQLDRHRRFARVTLPLWLYVSVTGVVIYLMLYHPDLFG